MTQPSSVPPSPVVRLMVSGISPVGGAPTASIWSAATPRSSLPAASDTVTLGVSETGSTVISIVRVEVALLLSSVISPPLATVAASVEVAVTVSVKSVSSSAGGVMVRAERSQSLISTSVPSPLNRLTPSVRIAPAGTPLSITVNASEPSVSVAPTVMGGIVIGVSSSPLASPPLIVGKSATASIVAVSVVVVEPVSPSSLAKLVTTVRDISPSLSAGGKTYIGGRLPPGAATVALPPVTSTSLPGAVPPTKKRVPGGNPEISISVTCSSFSGVKLTVICIGRTVMSPVFCAGCQSSKPPERIPAAPISVT